MSSLTIAAGRRGALVVAAAVTALFAGTLAGAGQVAVASTGTVAASSGVSTEVAAATATGETAGCPRSLWRDDEGPAVASTTSTGGVELGVKFRTDRDGYITGVRFYKGPGNTGTHLGRLWSWRGEKLGQATFTSESTSGWQRATFAYPVRVASGTTYVVSYYAPVGRYSYSYDYFASASRVRAPLIALKNGTDGGNGVYRTGAGFPTSTYRSINYSVDVIFDSASDDTCPATVWTDSETPKVAAVTSSSSVELGMKFRTERDGFIQGVRFFKGSTNTGAHVGRLWSETGEKLAEARFMAESSSGWQQAWFSQPVGVTAGTTYVVSYLAPSGHYGWTEYAFASSARIRGPLTALADGADGSNGVYLYGTGGFPRDTYHSSSYGVDVMFTTSSTLPCPCTIWPTTADTAARAATDTRAVELGVRFRPMREGYVRGVRFLKGDGNMGTHVGSLWSNVGTKLAQATFSGESSNGWQQALFSSPVAVTAGTTYVASYSAPGGRYAYDPWYLAGANTTRGPLAAMANGVAGANGVYSYGGGFPSSTYQSANYWVDVMFDTGSGEALAPVVVGKSPLADADTVPVNAAVTARFSEPVVGSSVKVVLATASGSPVAGSTSYDATIGTALFTPSAPLSYSTDYVVDVSGARDIAGNTMQAVHWAFATGIDPESGPGGPVGVITSSTSPYSAYYAEILRTEGLNSFTVLPLETLTAADLAKLDVAILADVSLTNERTSLLTTWVEGGGSLVAMHPDPKLASLLGLSPAGSTLSNGYLAVDPATPPGAGITTATMQFHGSADRYSVAGATMVARLYSSATTSTSNPAVTMRDVGAAGGKAAAFTYDLARSVALTRQGNPDWAEQERDGLSPIRSDDLFYGGSSTDWVNLSKAYIPQADEQQRLLVNLIEDLNAERKPLPRFWYLPDGDKAVVVATGDDEAPGTSGTEGRFDRYIANSAKGCSPVDWQCLRFTSYLFTSVALTDAQARAYHEQGFEVALHAANGCNDFTPSSLDSSYTNQLAGWAEKFVSLPMPTTARYHCIAYSDWDSQPTAEYAHRIRFDANYYYWPGSWVQDRPGFMTGSGIPMRFTDTTGRMIDVYQGATVMTDESRQSYPFTPNTLLDRALGTTGYYGMFVANMHPSNQPTSYEDDQLVASAQNHSVPVITARNVLNWLDGRSASSFGNLSRAGNSLTFTITAPRSARGLVGMLPTAAAGAVLTGLTRDGTTVEFALQTVKGIEYAMFPAVGGSYTATYAAAPAAATATAATVSASVEGTATVAWTSGAPATTEVDYGTSTKALKHSLRAESTRKHTVMLTGLAPSTTYYYRVTSTDGRGRPGVWPQSGGFSSFTTPAADTRAPAVLDLRITPLPDSTVRVSWRTNEPASSSVSYGDSPDRLDRSVRDTDLVTAHMVVITDLDAQKSYFLRVGSADASGNSAALPPAAAPPASFVTARAGVADQTRVGFRTGKTTGAMVVRGAGLADLTLSSNTALGAPATGTLDSRILDAQQNARWDTALWDADLPHGARMTVWVRTGHTAEPDASWSSWSRVVGSGGNLNVPSSRYVQYRVELTAGQRDVPAVHWIAFTHDGRLPGADRRAARAGG